MLIFHNSYAHFPIFLPNYLFFNYLVFRFCIQITQSSKMFMLIFQSTKIYSIVALNFLNFCAHFLSNSNEFYTFFPPIFPVFPYFSVSSALLFLRCFLVLLNCRHFSVYLLLLVCYTPPSSVVPLSDLRFLSLANLHFSQLPKSLRKRSIIVSGWWAFGWQYDHYPSVELDKIIAISSNDHPTNDHNHLRWP